MLHRPYKWQTHAGQMRYDQNLIFIRVCNHYKYSKNNSQKHPEISILTIKLRKPLEQDNLKTSVVSQRKTLGLDKNFHNRGKKENQQKGKKLERKKLHFSWRARPTILGILALRGCDVCSRSSVWNTRFLGIVSLSRFADEVNSKLHPLVIARLHYL